MRVAPPTFAALLLATVFSSHVLSLGPIRVDQKTYNRIDDQRFKGLAYVYVGDIESDSRSPGFKPFALHVLVGSYRAPLLGSKGFLQGKEDLERALQNRRDVWRKQFLISRPSGETQTFTPPGMPPFKLRVQKVVPVKGGTDHVLIEVF